VTKFEPYYRITNLLSNFIGKTMDTKNLTQVDHTAIKVNQAVIILLNIVAFILNAPWLAGIVAIAMLIGTLVKAPGFKFVYRILRSAQIAKPDLLQDNPEPHRFAQGFGGVVMLAGTILLFSGADVIGWGLVWMVTALAALNLFGGFCVGCAVYYWLSRLHVPGFTKKPPANTLPGMRPKVKV
jgi:hypothetical protein